MHQQLLVKEFTIDPVTNLIKPRTWIYWQGCLFNLLCFFNIITRADADILTVVSTHQQIRQITTDNRIVSGESVDNAIRLFNQLPKLTIPGVQQKFVKCRLDLIQGCITIFNIWYQSDRDCPKVMFIKVYSKKYVPGEGGVLSEIGHWIAIAKFITEGDVVRLYYIDVQSSLFIELSHISHLYHQLYLTYTCMDLIYMGPVSIPLTVGEDAKLSHTRESLESDLEVNPLNTPLLTIEQQLENLQPLEPIFAKFVEDMSAQLRDLESSDHFDDPASVFQMNSRKAAAAARALQGYVDETSSESDEDIDEAHNRKGGHYRKSKINRKLTSKLKVYHSKKQIKKQSQKKQSKKKQSKKNFFLK